MVRRWCTGQDPENLGSGTSDCAALTAAAAAFPMLSPWRIKISHSHLKCPFPNPS